jgi:hypothetical protein
MERRKEGKSGKKEQRGREEDADGLTDEESRDFEKWRRGGRR